MKIVRRLKNKIMILAVTVMLCMNKYVHADVVQEVSGGGAIQSSKLGQGIFKMIRDIIGTLQWLLPLVCVAVALYNIVKMATGDEQERSIYLKRLKTTAIVLIVGLLSVTIVNLITNYFA